MSELYQDTVNTTLYTIGQLAQEFPELKVTRLHAELSGSD
jgi:hypothetical protein